MTQNNNSNNVNIDLARLAKRHFPTNGGPIPPIVTAEAAILTWLSSKHGIDISGYYDGVHHIQQADGAILQIDVMLADEASFGEEYIVETILGRITHLYRSVFDNSGLKKGILFIIVKDYISLTQISNELETRHQQYRTSFTYTPPDIQIIFGEIITGRFTPKNEVEAAKTLLG